LLGLELGDDAPARLLRVHVLEYEPLTERRQRGRLGEHDAGSLEPGDLRRDRSEISGPEGRWRALQWRFGCKRSNLPRYLVRPAKGGPYARGPLGAAIQSRSRDRPNVGEGAADGELSRRFAASIKSGAVKPSVNVA
jgi:hypothetical protein